MKPILTNKEIYELRQVSIELARHRRLMRLMQEEKREEKVFIVDGKERMGMSCMGMTQDEIFEDDKKINNVEKKRNPYQKGYRRK